MIDAPWVCDRLDAEYGLLAWRSHGEPLDALVQTILSQHTSDINSERAFDTLRRTFPGGWDPVRVAPVDAIADAIRAGGLANSKAPRIKAVLETIHARTGATDLGFLKGMPTDEIQAFLHSFHGVGPKTAACVLMFSLGRPVLPVDTHVFRVSHRLGLVPEKIGEARAHDALQAQVPDARVYGFHVHLIRHGRRVCVARGPRCGACVLSERCAYAKRGGVAGRLSVQATTGAERVHGLKGTEPPLENVAET
jgi:endonuclease-3